MDDSLNRFPDERWRECEGVDCVAWQPGEKAEVDGVGTERCGPSVALARDRSDWGDSEG